MSYFLDLKEESNEAFLNRVGRIADGVCRWKDIPKGYAPVVLFDGLLGPVASVGYNEMEYEALTNPHYRRYKKVYFVPIRELALVVDLDLVRFSASRAA
jgi:hypothetical protein